MFTRTTLVVLALCGALSGCATEQESAFSRAFGWDNETITSSNGGMVSTFLDAADEVVKTRRKVRIDGQCVSSCAVFADFARPNVCITERAVFKFHQTTRTLTFVSRETLRGIPIAERVRSVELRESPPASPDILSWVEARGGFPSKGFLEMDATEAKSFWSLCME